MQIVIHPQYITVKAGVDLLMQVPVGSRRLAQWSEHLQLKQEALGLIPMAVANCLGFSSSSCLTNVDGMNDLWCSSTVRLLSIQIRRMWRRIYGALVGFSCY